MRSQLLAGLFFLSLATMGVLSAQPFMPFSQQTEWEQIQTDHFVVHYPESFRESAEEVARYAEVARYQLGISLDYRPEGPFNLVYQPHAEAALFSAQPLQEAENLPGQFNMPRNYGVVIHPGTTGDLFKEVKRQVTRVILKEFTFGYRVGSVMQKQVLLYNADWFAEGLADFMGYDWTFEDEQTLATLTGYQLTELAQEGQGPLHRVARKSIWHYIHHEYGGQKISEIIYLVNISHSIESGVISVLGITLNTLTARWQQYLASRFRTQVQGRTFLSEEEAAIRIPPREGFTALNFALHAPSQRIAVYYYKKGQADLWIYDLEAHRFQATPISSGLSRIDGANLTPDIPVAWSHDGSTLVTTRYSSQGYELAFLDIDDNEVVYKSLPKTVEKINSMAWATDDARIAYSIRHNGQSDIWEAQSGTVLFRPLTDDGYDDLDPVWSLDDQFIFFSSNRDTLAARSNGESWRYWDRSFDLFKLVVAEEVEIKRLSRTPDMDERAPQPISSFEVLYESNASGIHNLQMVNVFQLTHRPYTNLAVGVGAYLAAEGEALIRQPVAGVQELFLVPLNALEVSRAPSPTLLRLATQAARKEARRRELALKQSAPPKPKPAEPAPKEEPKKTEEEKGNAPVRYYIFDEEDEPYQVTNPSTSQPTRPTRTEAPSRIIATVFGQEKQPELEDIEVERVGIQKPVWQADHVGFNAYYDPFAKLGLDMYARISDLYGHHQFEGRFIPFFNFNNYQLHLGYTYLKGRVDWFVKGSSQSRQMRELASLNNANEVDSAIFRFNQVNLQAGGRYPLSSYAAVEASVGYYRLSRLDQKLRRGQLFENTDNLMRAGARITWNNVTYSDGFRQRGFEAYAGVNSFYSINQGNFAMHRTQFGLKWYQPVYEQVTLAVRLDGALNFPREIEQYYLGGVDARILRPITFQNGESQNLVDPQLDTALYETQFLDFATPVRGFRNAVRSGSRYLLSNIELRIPVSRLLKKSLSSSHLYNLTIIPFVDVGAVWVEGNPFSQRKPTDTQFIAMGTQGNFAIKLQTLKSPFLVGFGSGVRLNVMGWSFRTDLAWGVDDYTVQRPTLTISMGRDF